MTNELHVRLKITGCDQPGWLTDQLDIQPTDHWLRGDKRGEWTATYSGWILHSPSSAGDAVEEQVNQLLALLEPRAAILRALQPPVEALFSIVAYWCDGGNLGINLPKPTVDRIARVGVGIDVDFYSMIPPPTVAQDPDTGVTVRRDEARRGVVYELRYESGGWIELFRADADGSLTVAGELKDLSGVKLEELWSAAAVAPATRDGE